MTIRDVLTRFVRDGVELWEDEGQLRYRAPKGRLSPKDLQFITDNRRTIQMLVGAARRKTERPSLSPRARPEHPPLSAAQRRVWFTYQMDGPNARHNIPLTLHLKGGLDVAALELALDDVLRRHESLRTWFPLDQNDVPFQEVLACEDPAAVLKVDRRTATEPTLPSMLDQEAGRPIVLGRGLPMRASLFRVADDVHVLLVIVHHIAADGASMAPFARDLAMAYEARLGRRTPEFKRLPVHYIDYALWQRELLTAETDPASPVAGQGAYWRKVLADLPDCIQIPTDRPRPVSSSYRGETIPVAIPEALRQRLQNLSRSSGATLFMALLAGLAILLNKMGAGNDVAVGAPVSGRSDIALTDLVGVFLNTLVIRTDLFGDPTVAELLARVRDTCLAAYAHQDLPFERVVEIVNPVRSQNHTPLFQVMLVLHNNPTVSFDLPNLECRTQPVRASAAYHDLTLTLAETDNGIDGTFEFATDLYDRASIEALAARFLRVLDGMAASPNAPVRDIAVLSSQEQRQIIFDWNDTMQMMPASSLADMLQGQAARSPDAIALSFGDAAITYAVLDARANRLAQALTAAGIGPEDIVGLALHRSPELVIGFVAIIKAGAAFVALDPQYPAERLNYMVADARPRVILTTTQLSSRFVGIVPTVCLDNPEAEEQLTQIPRSAPTPGCQRLRSRGGCLASLIYTSGSTGQPKAAMGTYDALLNRLLWDIEPAAPGTVYAQKTSPNSNDFLWEVLAPLVTGHRIHIIPEEASRDIPAMVRHLAAGGVSRFVCFPSMLQALLDTSPELRARLPRLDYWSVGGEAVTPALIETFRYRMPSARLLNIYGASEVGDAIARAIPDEGQELGSIIGRPITGVRAYILDGALRSVPVGVAGELYIAGRQLGRGYLRRPGLTATRFIACPFGPPGARMYRTGDLAKWRADGTIDYLNRSDQQLNIRGFRVEPGEIEGALVRQPNVAGASVLVREDKPGHPRLVAYVALRDVEQAPPDPEVMRRALGTILPDHMVPAAVVVLRSLPMTQNGKVDRRALPPPVFVDDKGRPARTALEQVLVRLFADVLRLDAVPIDSSFFDLGGHSLLATRLISLVRSALAVELPIRVFFEAPTVRQLAERLEQDRAAPASVPARPVLRALPRSERVVLSAAQHRLWLLNQLEGPSGTYNVAMMLRLRGKLDGAALQAAMGDVVARHDSLRTRFPEGADPPYQDIVSPALANLELRYCAADEQALGDLVEQAASAPFQIDRDLPIRATLFRMAESSHVLLVVIHHIACDGASLRPLARDLARAYKARLRGCEPDLEPLAVQYADYTLWQNQLLGDAGDPDSVMARQGEYWRQALSGLPDCVTLPTDRPRPRVASYRGDSLSFRIDRALQRDLKSLAQGTGCSLFMVLQAALAMLLGRLGAGDDIALGVAIAGRTDTALEELVGFFVNTLVLRVDLDGNPAVSALLKRVRETSLAAYGHQDLPFERLVEIINPPRAQNRHPLFQVMLVLQSNEAAELELQQVEWRFENVSIPVSKFDLTLTLSEEEDGIDGVVEYATDLFSASTIEMVVGRFLRVLEAFSAEPERRIGEIDLLTPGEREQVMRDRNQSMYPVPDATIPVLFEARAARTPDATALVFEDRRISYAELNERANRLARYLIARGIGPEDRVAVWLPRSLEMVVSLLAIVKAGAAYLPLDLDYPVERLRYMVADAQPCAVVTIAGDVPELPAAGLAAIVLDQPDVAAALARMAHANPTDADRVAALQPRHPAYVIYTSGSTGLPKGVVGMHASLVNRSQWYGELLPVDRRGPSLFKTSLNFIDGSSELFSALLHAGEVVIAGALAVQDVGRLGELAAAHSVANITVVPSLLRAILASPGTASSFAGCRTWISSGEALRDGDVDGFVACYPDALLLNFYGASEAGGDSLFIACDRASNAIGRPIWNTQVYVLDAALRLVPVGATGELYIAGRGLARGYLGRPGLTAERFVACPFGAPGERMFRTGDLARWRVDGVLDFQGRADQQVKIRGVRIEPGEVEAALGKQAGVAQACVIARADQEGRMQLVGYVVADATAAEIDPAGLRRALAVSLPDVMVPAAIVRLGALPLTPNGKLDRRALPAPEFHAGQGRRPEAPHEITLAALFAEILGADDITIDDNFFDLGGDSLRAMRLTHRIYDEFSVNILARTVFSAPTVSTLSQCIASLKSLNASDAEAKGTIGDDVEVGVI